MKKVEGAVAQDQRKTENVEFEMPTMGETLGKHQKDLDESVLSRGRLDFVKYLESVKGQLTQEQFELVRSCALDQNNLMATSDKLHAKNIETKFLLLKRRFFLDKDNVVRDHKNSDNIVCEPDMIFNLVMCGHVKNGHMHWRRLHRNLKTYYANVTRDFTQLCVRYCSKCNATKRIPPQQKYRHYNIYNGLLPLERVHVEIVSPLPTPIEGTYSHILYCRDYHSRFVWMLPLKTDNVEDLTGAFSTFLLSLPRIPMFIETASMDRRLLFEICEKIACDYSLTLGLGMSPSRTFQRNGITRLRHQLKSNSSHCIASWPMCLKSGATDHNLTYNNRVQAIPGNLLHSTVSDYVRQFEQKREKLIEKLAATNVVVLRKAGRRQGLLYLEDETTAFHMPDEDYSSTEYDTEGQFDTPINEGSSISSSPQAHSFIEPAFSSSGTNPLLSDKPEINQSPEISMRASVGGSLQERDPDTLVNASIEL
ncbi:LAFA_0E05666g1_1 [Lachancea sp. 'fantastica']|nr:LAFA_0E05666g1_1 [Lachancea sp. 'fantastica']